MRRRESSLSAYSSASIEGARGLFLSFLAFGLEIDVAVAIMESSSSILNSPKSENEVEWNLMDWG